MCLRTVEFEVEKRLRVAVWVLLVSIALAIAVLVHHLQERLAVFSFSNLVWLLAHTALVALVVWAFTQVILAGKTVVTKLPR